MAQVPRKKFVNLIANPSTWVYFTVTTISLGFLIIFFGMWRGFDWTDEAWAFSLSASGRVSVGEPWAFQYLMYPIVQLLGGQVIGIRIFRFIVFILLGVGVATALARMAFSAGIRLNRNSRILLFGVTQIGTLLAWSWPPRYFAYNEITSVLVQAAIIIAGFLLFLERSNSRSRVSTRVWIPLWAVTGITVGLVFYGRFTGFILLLPVVFIMSALGRRGRRLLATVAYGVGISVGIGVPYLLGLPIQEYLGSIKANILDEGVRAANNHSSGLIQMYLNNLWQTFITVLPAALLLLLILVMLYGVFRERKWAEGFTAKTSIGLLGLLFSMTFCYVILSGGGAERTGKIAIVLLFAGVTLIYVFSSNAFLQVQNDKLSRMDAWRIAGVSAAFIMAPVIASFGTNNPLTIHFGFDATIWAGAAALGLALWNEFSIAKARYAIIAPVAAALIGTLSFAGALGEAKDPYRSASFIGNSVTVTKPGPLQGLMVTPDEKSWLDWLQTEAVDLDANGVPTISLKSAGALLAFNNSSFVSPWLESFWPASFWSIKAACSESPPSDLLVLVPGTTPPESPEWNDLNVTLRDSCGLEFSEDFELVSHRESSNPQFALEIWRLKSST